MLIDDPVNKCVRFSPTPKARARKIRRLNSSNTGLNKLLLQIVSCAEEAKRWNDLSPAERIMLELNWTDYADKLLSFGNTEIMRSIRYRLREQSPEEEVEEQPK